MCRTDFALASESDWQGISTRTAYRALIGSSVFRDLLGSFSKKRAVVRPSREEMAGRKLAEFREDRCSLWQSDPTYQNGPDEDGAVETRMFGTTVPALETLREWLLQEGCTSVAMESTGSYWIPVKNILEGAVRIVLVCPKKHKPQRGDKTDFRMP